MPLKTGHLTTGKLATGKLKTGNLERIAQGEKVKAAAGSRAKAAQAQRHAANKKRAKQARAADAAAQKAARNNGVKEVEVFKRQQAAEVAAKGKPTTEAAANLVNEQPPKEKGSLVGFKVGAIKQPVLTDEERATLLAAVGTTLAALEDYFIECVDSGGPPGARFLGEFEEKAHAYSGAVLNLSLADVPETRVFHRSKQDRE